MTWALLAIAMAAPLHPPKPPPVVDAGTALPLVSNGGISIYNDGGSWGLYVDGGTTSGTNTGDQTKNCGAGAYVTILAPGTSSTCGTPTTFTPTQWGAGQSGYVTDSAGAGASDAGLVLIGPAKLDVGFNGIGSDGGLYLIGTAASVLQGNVVLSGAANKGLWWNTYGYGLLGDSTSIFLSGVNIIRPGTAHGGSMGTPGSPFAQMYSDTFLSNIASGSVAVQVGTGAKFCLEGSGASCCSSTGGVTTCTDVWAPASISTGAINGTTINGTSQKVTAYLWSTGTIALGAAGIDLYSSTLPTIASGFGTSPSIAGNGTATFRVTIGSAPGSTGVLTMPATFRGSNCFCEDLTTRSSTVAHCRQIGVGTTTSITLGEFDTTMTAANWVAADVVEVHCPGM